MKTIQELIRIVQDRISLPLDDDDRWSTTAVVNAFNHALDDKLAPDLISEGSNYLVHRDVFTLSNYPLKAIPIPNRAAGRVIREVKYIASGTEIENEINCLAITLEDKDKYINDPLFYGSTVPYVFIENDSVRFIGGDGTGSIAIYYSLEPSILQNTTGQYATVTDCQLTATLTVNTQTGSNTLTNPSIAPTSLNLLNGMPISGPNIPTGATITSVTSSTIVISSAANGTATNQSITIQKNQILATAGTSWDAFQATGTTKFVDIYRKTTGAIVKANVRVARSSTLTTSYVISDLSSNEINQIKTYQYGGFPVSAPYESELVLLPAGKSEFSTIPYEYDQLLALYVCERILESLGDTEGLQVTMTKIKETKESISRLSQNRLIGEPNKLEDRRSSAKVEERSIQSLLLDVYDKMRSPIDKDPRWSKPALIRAFNAAINEKLKFDLISPNSNYLVQRDIFTLSNYALRAIPIPNRAIGRIIREVKFIPSGSTSISNEISCPVITIDDKDKYSNDPEFYNSVVPYVFIENDTLRFVGGDLTGTIAIYYNIEPSLLQDTVGQYATITGISSTSITVSTESTSWISYFPSNVGTVRYIDVYRRSTGTIVKANVKLTRASSITYTINNLLDDEINQIKNFQSGAFSDSNATNELILLPSGKSEFLTIPEEYDQLLVLYVCERILESLKDTEGLQVIMSKIKETKETIASLTQSRIQSEKRGLRDRRILANPEPRSAQSLILDVYDRLPISIDEDQRWSTSAILRTMNTVLVEKITPEIVSQESNYLVYREAFSIPSYSLKSIPLPQRAVGRILREVKYLSASSSNPDDEINCLMISLDEKDKYSKDPGFYNSSAPYVYIEHDYLKFIGGPTTGSIVMYYNLQPSVLTLSNNRYVSIMNWTGSSNTYFTVAEGSSWWSSWNNIAINHRLVDMYRKSTGAIIKTDLKVTRSVTGDLIEYAVESPLLSASEVSLLKSNQQSPGYPLSVVEDADLVLLPAGKADLLTIPEEYDQLLVLYTCERILQSIGDTQNLQIVAEKIKETKDSISRISQNRIQGEKIKLEDRRAAANPESRSIQSLILDLYDTVRVPFDKDTRWYTAAIIRAFNNAMIDKIAPELVAEGANYLVHRDVIPLTISGSPVYPLNSIPLPRRAIGRALREVKYLPSGKTKLEDELNCPAISLEEKDMYSSESDVYGSSVPYIYIENDNLRFISGDLNGSLVLYYNLEPSKLTATYGRYATITSWTSASNTINTASEGTNWSSYIVSGSSKLVDIFCKSTGSILKSNVLVTRNTNSYTISGLTTDEIVQIRANQSGGFPTTGSLINYPAELMLVPAGECEFVTIPEEFDQLLVLYVAEKISESLGDAEGLTIIKTKINETRNSISRVTGNRLQGERRRLTDRRSIARIQRGQKWTRNYNKNYR
jgi:urate oxidase